ncbi:MAG: ABC transporter permease [Planctomycetaceae bacterium]
MSLLAIAWKSIRQRLLSSSLTAVSVALGVALMVAVLVINGVFSRMFSQDSVGYDLVVGGKGSTWQLILNTIYRVDRPIVKMPWRYYTDFIAKRPDVETAIPLAVSDTTEQGNFPIVATTKDFFRIPYAYGKQFAIPKGQEFLRRSFDAVIGSEVARKNGWTAGSEFRIQHAGADEHVHDEKFTVRGVLAPTNTANDRTAFIEINGFFLIGDHDEPLEEAIAREMKFFNETEQQVRDRYAVDIARMAAEEAEHAGGGHDHAHHHHDHGASDLKKGVSAILLVMRGSPERPAMHQASRSGQAMKLVGELRESPAVMAVQPFQVMLEITTSLIGNINLMLLVLTGLIIAVSGISIFVSIYNSMATRRREIAIMRALGAPRSSVFSVILIESLLLCLGGALLGLALGHGLVFVAAPIVEARSGFLINPFTFERAELWLIPAMVLMATLVGFLPGLTAYRTNVAAALTE